MSDSETPRFERKATLRLGQRELSFISLGVIVVILGLLSFGVYRAILGFRAHRDVVVAKDHLHQLYVAMQTYAQDWDGKLPAADRWMDAVGGYLSAPPNTPGGPQSYLHGSGDDGDVGYVYNDLASGYELEPSGKSAGQKRVDPSRLILLIEKVNAPDNSHTTIPPQDSAQAEEALYNTVSFAHYASDPQNATTVILYADGNIVTQTRQDLKH